MPKQSAPTKATGGGGYTFADKVAAGFLAKMLKRKFPLESGLGPIAELHFETRDMGHALDDLMLVLKRGLDVANCVVSVKSNRQLNVKGFQQRVRSGCMERMEWQIGLNVRPLQGHCGTDRWSD